MARPGFFPRRGRFHAGFMARGAARIEAAAWGMWNKSGAWPGIPVRALSFWDGPAETQEALRIGMGRTIKDIVCRPLFDDDAGIHDVNAAAHLSNDAEIMGDETTAMPNSVWRRLRTSRTWASVVTSRAVVGSSAKRSRGEQDRAMAMRQRWRMPPDNSWGY